MKRVMKCAWSCARWLLMASVACIAQPIYAQADMPLAPTVTSPTTLTGTLAKVRTAGSVALGYREASVPFSYLSERKEPIGYSIALCRALVDAMGQAVNRSLTIKWVPVTSESRFAAVAEGRIDLECGSTTNNRERQKLVGFSPTTFVSGTKLMVRRSSSVKSFRDLAGKAVAVTSGTTNEKTLRELSEKFKLNLNITAARDHAESLALLKSGRVEAFATDDVLLYGFIAQENLKRDFQVVGEYLSYDPYAIMFRKDDADLKRLVNETFQALAADGEIERQYNRWFLRKLPSGASLDLPMSAQLEAIIEATALKPEQ